MSSQTRTGKINTTILILINIQSYQRLRGPIHTVTDLYTTSTMTSQCPVKIHVVASCSILHHKITVPASNGKLTCLLQKLKQTYSSFLQVRDKNWTDRR